MARTQSESKAVPHYKDVDALMRYLSPRLKIVSREKSGVSANFQRKLSKQIKYARYLALIPYTSYQNES